MASKWESFNSKAVSMSSTPNSVNFGKYFYRLMLAKNSSILVFTSTCEFVGRDFVFCFVCCTSPGTKGCSSGACYALG